MVKFFIMMLEILRHLHCLLLADKAQLRAQQFKFSN